MAASGTSVSVPVNDAIKQMPPYTCSLVLKPEPGEEGVVCGRPARYLGRRQSGDPAVFLCDQDNHWAAWPLDRQEDLVPGVAPEGLG